MITITVALVKVIFIVAIMIIVITFIMIVAILNFFLCLGKSRVQFYFLVLMRLLYLLCTLHGQAYMAIFLGEIYFEPARVYLGCSVQVACACHWLLCVLCLWLGYQLAKLVHMPLHCLILGCCM